MLHPPCVYGINEFFIRFFEQCYSTIFVSKYRGVPFGLIIGGNGERRRPFCGYFVKIDTSVEYFELRYAASWQYLLLFGISATAIASLTMNCASVTIVPEILTRFALRACLAS